MSAGRVQQLRPGRPSRKWPQDGSSEHRGRVGSKSGDAGHRSRPRLSGSSKRVARGPRRSSGDGPAAAVARGRSVADSRRSHTRSPAHTPRPNFVPQLHCNGRRRSGPRSDPGVARPYNGWRATAGRTSSPPSRATHGGVGRKSGSTGAWCNATVRKDRDSAQKRYPIGEW